MSLPHWEYFLAIEKDLETCARFVEFCEDNCPTYSLEFARIILASCTEVDAVFKNLCKEIEPRKSPEKIKEYYSIIHPKYPKLIEHIINIPRFKMFDIQPWKEWTNEKSPDWWTAYNKIKHERDKNFKEANLKNAINSSAALLSLILYYYQKIHNKKEVILMSGPEILEPKWYGGMEPGGIFWSFTLPDE